VLTFRSSAAVGRSLLALAVAAVTLSCSDIKFPPAPVPTLTSVKVTVATATLLPGQTSTATAAVRDQNDVALATSPAVTWSSTAPTVATVSVAGLITAVAPGTAQITATAGGKSGTQTVTVNASPAVRINEVESNGGTPGDWVELYNSTAAAVDISGWGFRDNDSTHTIYKIPAGTSIPAGGYYLVEEAQFGFGLGALDEARLYNQYGALVEFYGWSAHAAVTYGRCPNGTGPFLDNATSTKGVVNNCAVAPPTPPTTPPTTTNAVWPGLDDVTTVDRAGDFTSNMSGLMYEAASAGKPAVLWAARNGPGAIFRLIKSGSNWIPDPTNGWDAGKAVKYTDGTGELDAEGITFAAGGSANGIYVSSERNNSNNSVSRNSVLRFDVSGTATTLTATNEWNLTADLPVTGANLGLEAIAWIPDSVLVAKKFFDQKANKTYVPADYPNHGTGIFFVGLETNGFIYAYALNHSDNSFARVATIDPGYTAGVMDLNFDPSTNYLWAVCDDGCGGTLGILEIDTNAASPTFGRFLTPRKYQRPASMPNINNEGFTVTPASECVANRKPVFWSDDNDTGGFSIRTASMNCGPITAAAQTLRVPIKRP
jgi:hypothetical protein